MRTAIALASLVTATVANARTIVSGSNDFYIVSADLDRNGAYAVGTGSEHRVSIQEGQASTVLRGGTDFASGISFNVVRSYASHTDYFMGMPGFISDVEPGYDCVYINDAGVRDVEMISDGGRDVGFVIRWTIDYGADQLLVEERLVARGNEFTNSAAEVTLSVTNLGADDASIGLRYAWSLALGNSGGNSAPTIGPKPPEPIAEPLPVDELTVDAPSFRSYIISNEERPSAPGGIDDNNYTIEATMGGIPLDPPLATPDRFLYTPFGLALWPVDARTYGPRNACFSYDIAEPPRRVFNASTSAGVYFWGETPDTALPARPGETVSVTQYIFAYLNFPLVCDAGPPQVVECAGPTTAVELDGSASQNLEGEGLEFLWMAGDPEVVLENNTSEFPLANVAGLGRHEVSLLVHRGGFATSCTTEIEVVDTTPPAITATSVTPSLLWPPNHRMVQVGVRIEAEDLCDAEPAIRLVAVEVNEPDETRRGGDGNTTSDIQQAAFGSADFDLLLRAERRGARAGRTYTLIYEVTDSSGNMVEVPLRVEVPHDQRPSLRRR